MNKPKNAGHVIKANDSDPEDAYQLDHHVPQHKDEPPSFMNVPESKKSGRARVAMTKPSLPTGIHSKQSSGDHGERDLLHDLDHAEPFHPPV